VAQLVKRLPSAQVMIPESWDRVPHRAPPSLWGACFSLCLCLPLPLLVLSLSVKQINKIFKKKHYQESKKEER